MALGERLRTLRKHRGLTQDQVAAAANIERVVVVQVETGRNQASSYALRMSLAKAFGYGVERLSQYLDEEITLDELATGPRRDTRRAAAELAREDGIHEEAIRQVLAEPMDPASAARSTLWWALRMKVAEGQLVFGFPEDVKKESSGEIVVSRPRQK